MAEQPLPRVHVAAGILRNNDGSILIAECAQSRSMQGYWEFPGGKVEARESAEAALGRELEEELGIVVVKARHLHHLEYDYPERSVAIDFYLVSAWHGSPSGCEGQRLKWVSRNALRSQNLLPADAPVIEALESS